MTEQLATLAQSKLSSSIASGDTSLTLQSATGFPTTGIFRLRLDTTPVSSVTEIVEVGSVTGSILGSLTRGTEGTSARSWLSGATATVVLTAAGLIEYVSEQVAVETTRAEAAEGTNATAISAETTRAESAETTNATAITTETSRAETAEALLAPMASPVLTGNPTAPTQSALNNSTRLATTAYTDTAVGVETTRAEAAETLLAPKASPALTGNPTAPTQSPADGSTKLATTAYADTSAASAASGRMRTLDLGDAVWGVNADNGTTENGAKITAALATLTHGGVAHLPGNQAQNYQCNTPVIIPNGVRLIGDDIFGTSITVGTFPHGIVSGAQTTPASNATTFTLTLSSGGSAFPLGGTGISLAHGVGVAIVAGPTEPVVILYTGVNGSNNLTGCTTNQTSTTIANGATVTVPLIWLGEPGLTSVVLGTRIESLTLGGGNLAYSALLWSDQANENSGYFDIRFSNFGLLGARFDSPSGTAVGQARNYEAHKGYYLFGSNASSVAVGLDCYDAKGSPGANRGVSGNTFASNSGSNLTVLSAMRLNGVGGNYQGSHFENTPTGCIIGDKVAAGPLTLSDFTGQPSGFTDLIKIASTAGSIVNIRNAKWIQAPTTQNLIHDLLNSQTVTDQAVSQYSFGRDGVISTDSASVTGALRPGTTAVTQSASDNSTKVATTAYTDAAVSVEASARSTADALKAPLASPTFTGHPVGVTESAGNNSTRLATTAYTDGAVATETTRAEAAEALLSPIASPTFTGTTTAPEFSASGLTGSTAASRYVGATASGHPTTGAHVVGDFVVDQTGSFWVCSVNGTPGTWVQVAAGSGAPTGAAGGDLSGTYPNPGVANLNGVAASSYALLASPALTGTPTVPTAAVDTNTTQAASTAMVLGQAAGTAPIANGIAAVGTSTRYARQDHVHPISFGFPVGLHSYANGPLSLMSNAAVAMPNAGDGRWSSVVVDETGHLRDVSVLINTTQATTNMNILILDRGNAAAGTARTCLYAGTPAQVPAGGAWFTVDPNLAVTAGDTLELLVTIAATTAKLCGGLGNAGVATLPNSSFAPASGSGTASQKIAGTLLAADIPALSGTVTDANMVAQQTSILFVWRVS